MSNNFEDTWDPLNPFDTTIFDQFPTMKKSMEDGHRVLTEITHESLPDLDVDLNISEGNNIDLTEELLPHYVGNNFSSSEIISRNILSGYSDPEIRQVFRDVNNYYIKELNKINNTNYSARKIVTLGDFGGIGNIIDSLMISGSSPENITKVKKPSWPVFYASFCRLCIEKAVQVQEIIDFKVDNMDFINKYHLIRRYTSTLQEQSVAYAKSAEILAIGNPHFFSYTQTLKDKSSLLARSGGIGKKKKYDPIKSELTRLLKEGRYEGKSYPRIASILYKNFPKSLLVDAEGNNILKDPEARFASWIGQYYRSLKK